MPLHTVARVLPTYRVIQMHTIRACAQLQCLPSALAAAALQHAHSLKSPTQTTSPEPSSALAAARPSSSSKKMMQGAVALARANSAATAFSLSPTYFENSSPPYNMGAAWVQHAGCMSRARRRALLNHCLAHPLWLLP